MKVNDLPAGTMLQVPKGLGLGPWCMVLGRIDVNGDQSRRRYIVMGSERMGRIRVHTLEKELHRGVLKVIIT